MKNRTIKSIIVMSIILTMSYIVCIYKTVVLASTAEVNNKQLEILSADINQKEYSYIKDVSEINLDKAISLGYKRNTEDIISYVNTKDVKEFALR